MGIESSKEKPEELENWEREFFVDHRWGRLRKWLPERPELWNTEGAVHEHVKLKELWERIKPLDQPSKEILDAIIALEICNWNLEESVLSLCEAIGSKRPPRLRIGHGHSITEERWRKVWAYYLTLQKWLSRTRADTGKFTGYDALLGLCDPENEIQEHVLGMLGESSELKCLYVERFCKNLEFWIGGFFPEGSPQMKAYDAAVNELEKEIALLDPDPEVLEWMKLDGRRGWIEICHHKVFRRFDIQISSIGAGRWRGALPLKGSDGIARAETVEEYLFHLEDWLKSSKVLYEPPNTVIYERIHSYLGEPDDTKRFLASLLTSLLRSQQSPARERALKRGEQSVRI
jgi:hypothetical protein